MERIDHFSHKHPLSLIEIEQDEKEQSNNRSFHLLRCYGCTEKIESGVPFYQCKEECPLFCLHHACAHLPTTIKRWHSSEVCDRRDLQLMKHPNKNYEKCSDCWKKWYRFTYVCSVCKRGIDIRCARKGPNEAKHSFHQHPVQPFYYQNKVDEDDDDDDDSELVCSVCRLIITPFGGDRYMYYRCNYCSFVVHPDCTDIPMLFQSPLILIILTTNFTWILTTLAPRSVRFVWKRLIGTHNGLTLALIVPVPMMIITFTLVMTVA